MSSLFHEFLYRPLFNVLMWLYHTAAFEDLGLAIILLTILIRLILFPVFWKSTRNQLLLQKIQPEIKKIQHTHKGNREAQAQALMALYQQHRVNPFSGFLLLFIQLPILIALYRLFMSDFSSPDLWKDLYTFISRPETVHTDFLGLIPLGKRNIVIVALAAAAQFLQGITAAAKREKHKEGAEESAQARIGRQMVFIGPLLTLLILPTLPAAIGLYWTVTALFSAVQQEIIRRRLSREDGTYGSVSATSQKTP